MRDLDKALDDILAIRSQLAAGTAFRGYGPATIATTGGIALLTAVSAIAVAHQSNRPASGVSCKLGRRGRAVLDPDLG